jgi:hypothetical protein
MKQLAALCAVALALPGCNQAFGTLAHARNTITGDPAIPATTEKVLEPESSVTATTDVGVITITSGKGLRRSFTWEGATRTVVMYPRYERWYGSLGLYYPGPGSHWFRHNGITRGVIEEGQQHFAAVDDAAAWLRKRSEFFPLAFSNDGLVVGWTKTPARQQLSVDIWQVCVQGQKPTNLIGASQDRIQISKPSKCSAPGPAAFFR